MSKNTAAHHQQSLLTNLFFLLLLFRFNDANLRGYPIPTPQQPFRTVSTITSSKSDFPFTGNPPPPIRSHHYNQQNQQALYNAMGNAQLNSKSLHASSPTSAPVKMSDQFYVASASSPSSDSDSHTTPVNTDSQMSESHTTTTTTDKSTMKTILSQPVGAHTHQSHQKLPQSVGSNTHPIPRHHVIPPHHSVSRPQQQPHPHHNPPSFHHPYSHDEALTKLNYTLTGGYFHIYDIYSNNHEKEECQPFYEEHNQSVTNATAFAETITKYKLWSNLISETRMKQLTPNNTLYGLQHALDVIWKHQHPENCSHVNFMLPTEHNGGFGSELHVLSNPLGLAMDLNRVYLLNPLLHHNSMWELQTPFCTNNHSGSGSSKKVGFDCYYEPISSCTIYDALGPNALQILQELKNSRYKRVPHSHDPQSKTTVYTLDASHVTRLYSDAFLSELQHLQEKKVLFLHNTFRMGSKYIPRVFRPLMACSPIILKFQYYWWRAITMTYVIRPNNATMTWINTHRNHSYEEAVLMKHQQSTVGIYVRRGDKAREMRISPITEYIDGMRLLWSLNYLKEYNNSSNWNGIDQHHHPQSPRVIFLASESSEVIREMTHYVAQNNKTYDMYYTNVFDRKGLYAEKSASERDAGAIESHHPEEYLNMLLNIHHLLQADAWVCTIGSNFCRVIDELRATVAAKANAPYVDLSEEKCGQPPCIYGGFIDMDWR